MLLTALEIQGFKSFPDRTKILIGKGITAVVGPNGSGKSNISDAIRWVLGETSAKQLRGGGKMENVIFGGTQQRGAMGYAMVNLYVDNTDRRLEVDSNEVVIGRKYYRSGDSEYSINGQNVRLKDVYELFLDTGLGRDGYSVIGQGRIAEIVGAKSNERREIFEEASGIAKYRYRKTEAERRLAGAEENLIRLRDILGELERQVGPLEKESKKAKIYLELAARRKNLEVTLWVDTVHRAKDTLREQQRKIEIANADYTRMTQEIDTCETDATQLRAEQERCILEMNRLQEEIASVNEEIAGADTRIAVLRTNIAHNSDTVENMRAEFAQSTAGRENITAEIAGHEEAILACCAQKAEQEQRTAQLTEMLHALQTKSAASGERRGIISEKLTEMTTRITDLKVQAASAASAVEAAEARLAAAASDRTAAAENCRLLAGEQAETDAFLQEIGETLTRLENIKGGLSLKVEGRKKQLADADAREQELSRAIEHTQQRIQMLKDLERSMDGYQGSVKSVMKAAENHRLRGIIGPVASILSVKSGYELAVETALGFALQNVVVQNETAAKAAMTMLRDDRAGRATFLPLDTMRPGRFDGHLTGTAVRASDLVTYDARYEVIVSNLLGRIIVVDEINEASGVARSLDFRNRIVTKDGQVINAGGSFTGGSVSRSTGVFSRKQELEELRVKLTELSQQRSTAEAETDKIKAEVDALTAELTATESEAITAGGDKIRGETERMRIGMALSQATAAQQMLFAECEALTQQIAQNQQSAAESESEMSRMAEDSAKLETELSAITGDDDSFLDTRTRLSDEISETRLAAMTAQKDIENHESAIASLHSRTGDAEERSRALSVGMDALTQKSVEYETDIAAIEAAAAGSKDKIAAIRAQIDACATTRVEKEGAERQKNQEAKRRMDEREALSREIARLAEQKESRDAEYEQTLAKLWEEYELALSDAEPLCVPFESSAELRRDVAEVRGKIKNLGNVNVAAIEEYAEISQRYEFMRAQVGDVEQSKAELLCLITGLS
ncbi:MAG: chromosome segregation protein SMC, partial [Ruthenibacterium sp.]